jgi:hypothetical protein
MSLGFDGILDLPLQVGLCHSYEPTSCSNFQKNKTSINIKVYKTKLQYLFVVYNWALRVGLVGVLHVFYIFLSSFAQLGVGCFEHATLGHCRPLNGTIAHHKEKTKPAPRGPKGLQCCSHDIFAK